MNFEAGIRFILFLIIFGFTNYLMMLRRYEKEIKKKEIFTAEKNFQAIPKRFIYFLK